MTPMRWRGLSVILKPPRPTYQSQSLQFRRTMTHDCKVAVLYQACEVPIINGVQKPKKPGGYQDSGADIAYVLRQAGVQVATPNHSPDPKQDHGWCYPDTEAGILHAIEDGATVLWANTILFASHPLQTSSILNEHASRLRVVGQPPKLVEHFDDKNHVNELLRTKGRFTLPRCWIIESNDSPLNMKNLPYPIVGKPIRGRGSHGVKVCRSEAELKNHISSLLKESPKIMLEQFLDGQEGTVTVMPPTQEQSYYHSLPFVERFNHQDGIAPYSGVVAVTANSRVLSSDEMSLDPTYAQIMEECEEIASCLHVTAPIRVDVRRLENLPKSRFAAFDINMKSNMTGPGRPGRENQASLTALAASGLSWDYPALLTRVLATANTLQSLRDISI
ncbi:hypothetical protein, variant [Exophiala mesophila]|uniref:ATP-grasp domain-containing protein n=1 Tax=Exophiala mesophila TaxID=212818 RepID=A0A0D2ABM6_EXOME|nr:hypothetical protein, variant [Exophiala mesophila]KIV96328.1 hypothetical protein, variant [Exophiala mesophila]